MASTFKFRLFLEDGTDVDDYIAGRPDWSLGDLLYIEGQPKYRISAVIPMNDLDNEVYQGIWEVQTV